MTEIERQIEEMVHRETRAWDRKDADTLVSLFHPDMVWPWPPDSDAHDPALWVMVLGRFDAERWRRGWQGIFDTHELVHNHRRIVKVVVSEEGDGAFAVVDVDTLWRETATAKDFHWKGRACKIYTKTRKEWKLIAHTGLLDYDK